MRESTCFAVWSLMIDVDDFDDFVFRLRRKGACLAPTVRIKNFPKFSVKVPLMLNKCVLGLSWTQEIHNRHSHPHAGRSDSKRFNRRQRS